ncbi:MAG: hypothetical protein U0793_28230 [Gemmataceae bacterium]
MSFRRVEAQRAGANALGILIPPGKRTVVIVRPGALDCDLLPARWSGDPSQAPVFCDFTRDEAPTVARRLLTFLEETAPRGLNPLETFGKAPCFQIWLRSPDLFWIVCRRVLGEPYRPRVFATREEAIATGERLARYVWPVDHQQEVYFNTQKFEDAVRSEPET